MAKKKLATLKKPKLDSASVLGFAEARSRAGGKPRGVKRKPDEPAGSVTSRFPPEDDYRLTVNINKDLHQRLKIEAVRRRSTVGEIIEEMVEQHIKA